MRKKMMKLAALAMSAVMALSLAACGGGSGSGTSGGSGDGAQGDEADWTWERKVTLVCPWGVGGGADGTLRPLQPLLEEELGVPVEIVNVEGAGGANGVNYAYKQPADPVSDHAGSAENSAHGFQSRVYSGVQAGALYFDRGIFRESHGRKVYQF